MKLDVIERVEGVMADVLEKVPLAPADMIDAGVSFDEFAGAAAAEHMGGDFSAQAGLFSDINDDPP